MSEMPVPASPEEATNISAAPQNGAKPDASPVTPIPVTMHLFCTECGTKNMPDANFCKHCGQKMERITPLRISAEAFNYPLTTDERVSELLVLAFQNYDAGDLDAAVAACEQALQLHPESTSAHSLLGTLYEKRGDKEHAIAEYEKVLQLNPGSIADREKLEQLRDNTTRLIPRKITNMHPVYAQPVLTDTRRTAILAALGVFTAVLVIGTGVVLIRNNRTVRADAPPISGTLPGTPEPFVSSPLPNSRGTVMGVMPAPGSSGTTIQMPAQTAYSAANLYPYKTGAKAGTSVANAPLPGNGGTTPVLPKVPPVSATPTVPPATVNMPPVNLPDTPPRSDQKDNRTIYLPPDRSGQSSPTATPSGGETTSPAPGTGGGTVTVTNPNGTSTIARGKGSGRIEIIVTPGNGKASGTNNNGTNNSRIMPPETSAMDSRAAQAVARTLKQRGDYSRAITQYTKALDGAHDDAARIHQEIALCHQNLGEKESAISHYNDAIAAYRAQIAAGRGVEAAKVGIRLCEQGIRACQ